MVNEQLSEKDQVISPKKSTWGGKYTPKWSNWCELNQGANSKGVIFQTPDNICAFITWGWKLNVWIGEKRSNLKSPGGFPSTQHCLDSYDYPGMEPSGLAAANGVLFKQLFPSFLCSCQTNYTECFLSMNSERNLPELRVCVKRGSALYLYTSMVIEP